MSTPSTTGRKGGHRCPTCGAGLLRLHRDGLDRWLSRLRPAHRYGCVDVHCGWTGRLAVGAGTSWLARRVGPLPLSTWLMIGAVLALGLADGTRRYLNAQDAAEARRQMLLAAAEPEPPGPVPGRKAGWHFAGEPVPVNDPVRVAHSSRLALLRNCVWGDPGRNPYRGSPEEALKAAGLPPEVVREISAMIASGMTPDRVEIDNDGIRTVDGRREFSPTVPAMAFGRSLCLNTVVNFKAGHVEPARLFEASDRSGRRHSVMVPSVCGNVSVITERPLAADDGGQVLGERAEDEDSPEGTRIVGSNGSSTTTGGNTTTSSTGGGRSSVRQGGSGGGKKTVVNPAAVNQVPEPGTSALVVLGLAVMAFTTRRRNRRETLKKSP